MAEYYPMEEWVGETSDIMNLAFLSCFSVEMSMKLMALGCVTTHTPRAIHSYSPCVSDRAP